MAASRGWIIRSEGGREPQLDRDLHGSRRRRWEIRKSDQAQHRRLDEIERRLETICKKTGMPTPREVAAEIDGRPTRLTIGKPVAKKDRPPVERLTGHDLGGQRGTLEVELSKGSGRVERRLLDGGGVERLTVEPGTGDRR